MKPGEVCIRVHDDVVVMELDESVTADCTVLPEATRLMEQGSRKFLLNLGRVRHIDSAGLARIVWTFLRVRQQHGELKLFSVSERVRSLLDVSRLTPVFEAFDTEQDALQSFTPPVAPRAR